MEQTRQECWTRLSGFGSGIARGKVPDGTAHAGAVRGVRVAHLERRWTLPQEFRGELNDGRVVMTGGARPEMEAAFGGA